MSLYYYGIKKKTKISAPFAKSTNTVVWTMDMLANNFWRIEFDYNEYRGSKYWFEYYRSYDTHEGASQSVIDELLQRYPQTFFEDYCRKTKTELLMINLDEVDFKHDSLYKFHGKQHVFGVVYPYEYFPVGLALAENPKNKEKYPTSVLADGEISDASFPYDNNRLKIPANKDGSDYVHASPISVCDKFTFVIGNLYVDRCEDGSLCKGWCAESWSKVFHNDVRYVIVIENRGAKREEEFGPICHICAENGKKTYTRQILTENGVSEETFEVNAAETKKWKIGKKTLRNADFTIKQGNTARTVTHISIGNFNIDRPDYPSQYKDYWCEIIMDMADCFKEMVEVLDKIKSLNSKSKKVPRVMLASRSDKYQECLNEIFICVYYLWRLATIKPKALVKKQLWEHLSDLRLQRYNFVNRYKNLAKLVLLCQTLFLEGHKKSVRSTVDAFMFKISNDIKYMFSSE